MANLTRETMLGTPTPRRPTAEQRASWWAGVRSVRVTALVELEIAEQVAEDEAEEHDAGDGHERLLAHGAPEQSSTCR